MGVYIKNKFMIRKNKITIKALKSFLLILTYLFSLNIAFSQFNSEVECFSIIAGKNSNIENTVLLAHNEDDWGDLPVFWYKVPARNHSSGEKIVLQNGAVIDEIAHTYSYLWIEMPGMKFSDSYMNEWGVTIASDQCLSREDAGEIENGGIGYYLRRLMVERAKTAKEAVKIAGSLIEKLGYNYSGRTYCIADPNEAWMMAVVKGKHWVAQRIPDKEIAVIANCYTIDKINLKDTINFMGSKDIIDYAISRGWYNPEDGKEFSFKFAYSATGVINAIWNKPRAMTAINMLAKNKINYGDNFPFSFVPESGVSKQKIMKVLQSHLEDTDFESCNTKNPHKNIASRICSLGNQYGFVAELRDNLPKNIANVMWIAIKRPCIQPFIPWYYGITKIPGEFAYGNWQSALKNHFSNTGLKEKTKDKAYWIYKKLADITDNDYFKLTGILKENKKHIEKNLFENQIKFENEFLNISKNNMNKALKYLNEFENRIIKNNLNNTKSVLQLLK